MSEHALMNRSFSGTDFAFFLAALLDCCVIVIVAMTKKETPHPGGKSKGDQEK